MATKADRAIKADPWATKGSEKEALEHLAIAPLDEHNAALLDKVRECVRLLCGLPQGYHPRTLLLDPVNCMSILLVR